MTKKDEVRERIESQRRKVQQTVTEALDEIRDDLDKLRQLRTGMEERHEGFSEHELRERRQESWSRNSSRPWMRGTTYSIA